MDEATLATIADELYRAAPNNGPLSRAEAAAAGARDVMEEIIKDDEPQLVRALEAAVEFGYTSALEDIKGGFTESFGYSHREV